MPIFSFLAITDSSLLPQKEIILSDAYVVFGDQFADDYASMSKQYLSLLAAVYLQIPKPKTTYKDWPEILKKGLTDLVESPGCWSQVDGGKYFNAYVSDYETPPEIMVQLAVLLPLIDYEQWSGQKLEVIDTIKNSLPSFYDDKLKSLARWLPAAEDQLKGEEEQKQPMVMDAWYLHHPLLNLSRLAIQGDKQAKDLFLKSLGYAQKVAKHFKYKWPVFYKMDTLEVIKAETQPGAGGEKDVAGIYAHVMLQAWELTKEKKYLEEAERAAKTLEEYGFQLFYQANNTSFASGALLRLYKETKKEIYLNLSYLCLANVFQNVRLWECDYGFGKHFPSFFCLFPLSDAPYTAVYEEQEVFCALHDYLSHAQGLDILPAVRLMCAEYIKSLVNRAAYYYPPMLPPEALSKTVKTGELDPKLWIAVEDLHDGWEENGQVGQEVYGAGNSFGVVPRHYIKPTEEFMVYVEYPAGKIRKSKGSLSFDLLGDGRLTCSLRIIPKQKKSFNFELLDRTNKNKMEEKKSKEGHLEFEVNGNQLLQLKWKKTK
jgi:hypothetical protein